jgi:predicted RNA-binding Zn-ribbon protein involved in translation (DUF1610 family)
LISEAATGTNALVTTSPASDKNHCRACGHNWYPADVERATACPRCGGEDIAFSWTERYPAYAGCAAIVAFVLIIGWTAAKLGLAWLHHR